jgi:uncharacterized protein (TIGR03067 family)
MPSPCPDTELLRQLLDASLPEPATAELTQHLDACVDCRAVLDRLAGEGSSISAGARGLGHPPTEPEPGLERVLRGADRDSAYRDADGGAAEAITQAPVTPGETTAPTSALAPQADEFAATQASGTQTEDFAFLAALTTPGQPDRLGHYALRGVLGKGGFGVVLRAFDEKLHRMVAIKVLAPAYAAVGSARKRFVREARSAASVKNEHVVAIYGVQDETEPPYLVMELIDGISLEDKLDKHGPLSVREVLRIGLQLAEGLAAAHKQGLIHRDIKPANVLLENGVERVKITDFGLARAVDDASMTQSGTVAGTPMYMSPEQASGETIDHRSDLFSLGTVLYAMCTGHPPFRATGTHAVLMRVIEDTPRPIREINADIPEWLCDIISKLHAKKPEERFQTAKDVAELLGQHLAHLQQPTTVPLPAPVAIFRGQAAADDQAETLFPGCIWPRDGVDWGLAALLAPLVIGLYWVLPALMLYGAMAGLGLGQWAAPVSVLIGFILFVLLLVVAGLRAAERAIVNRRGIELVRYAGASIIVPWGKIRRIQEATRWEVCRRVWLWPGIPLRGSIMCSSALYQFRIEWEGGCYYFAPADEVAFRKAIAGFHAQTTRAEVDSLAASGRDVVQILEGCNTITRRFHIAEAVLGTVLALLAVYVGLVHGPQAAKAFYSLAAGALAFFLAAGMMKSRWDKVYRGHRIRFENGWYTGEALYIDGVLVDRCGTGPLRQLSGLIEAGDGAGDVIVATPDTRFGSVGCRIVAERQHGPVTEERIAEESRRRSKLVSQSPWGRLGLILAVYSLVLTGVFSLIAGYSDGGWWSRPCVECIAAAIFGLGALWQIVRGTRPRWLPVFPTIVALAFVALGWFLWPYSTSKHFSRLMREGQFDEASKMLEVRGPRDNSGWTFANGVLTIRGPGLLVPEAVSLTGADLPLVNRGGDWLRFTSEFREHFGDSPSFYRFSLASKRNGNRECEVAFRAGNGTVQLDWFHLWLVDDRNERRAVGRAEWLGKEPPAKQESKPPAYKDDKNRLQGHWVAESADDGEQLPPEQCALFTLTFTGSKLHAFLTNPVDRSGRIFHLDETTKPKQIDIINEDRRGDFGIYRFDGDRLVLCIGNDDAKDRPTEFSPKGGKARMVAVFKRAAPPRSGWVSHFTGKDLDGWKGQKDAWKIQDGALTATKIGEIEIERRITGSFHLRLQAKLKRGAAIIRLHSPGQKRGWTVRLVEAAETGKVDGMLEKEAGGAGWLDQGIAKLDEWFRMEIVAIDNEVEVLVNGKPFTRNGGFAPPDGHIGLEVLTEPHDVAFRDIEIKELPPQSRPDAGRHSP